MAAGLQTEPSWRQKGTLIRISSTIASTTRSHSVTASIDVAVAAGGNRGRDARVRGRARRPRERVTGAAARSTIAEVLQDPLGLCLRECVRRLPFGHVLREEASGARLDPVTGHVERGLLALDADHLEASSSSDLRNAVAHQPEAHDADRVHAGRRARAEGPAAERQHVDQKSRGRPQIFVTKFEWRRTLRGRRSSRC